MYTNTVSDFSECTKILPQIGMTPDVYQELFAEKDYLSVELENMSALIQVTINGRL